MIIAAMLLSKTHPLYENTLPPRILGHFHAHFHLQVVRALSGLKMSGRDTLRRSTYASHTTAARPVRKVRPTARETSSTAKISLHSTFGACTHPSRSRRPLPKAIASYRLSGRLTSRRCSSRVWSSGVVRHNDLRVRSQTAQACSRDHHHGTSGLNMLAAIWRKAKLGVSTSIRYWLSGRWMRM